MPGSWVEFSISWVASGGSYPAYFSVIGLPLGLSRKMNSKWERTMGTNSISLPNKEMGATLKCEKKKSPVTFDLQDFLSGASGWA